MAGLYVKRQVFVTGGSPFYDWLSRHSLIDLVPQEQLHVSVATSGQGYMNSIGLDFVDRQPATLPVDLGRTVQLLGSDDDVILRIETPLVRWRRKAYEALRPDLEWYFTSDDDIIPHITLAYGGKSKVDLERLKDEPYCGIIELGPENIYPARKEWVTDNNLRS